MVRYNEKLNTYKDIPISWDNLQEFQIMFLEAQYKLTATDYHTRLIDSEEFKDGFKRVSRINEIANMRTDAILELQETYKIVWSIRREIFNLYKYNNNYKEAFDEKSKEDFIFWINSFCWTFDPRLTPLGIPASLPLILFPGQVETLQRVDYNYRNNIRMLIEKSRAEGLTEMLCAYDIHHWLYIPGYKAGWGSRVRDLVDQSGNPDTIFERLRRILYALPENMRPEGMKSRGNKYDNSLRLLNPKNGASIIGEGGDNIGRGGRSSFYKIDEKANVEHQDLVDQALSENTNCQCDISTPKGMNHFYQKRMSGLVDVITVWWWMNPSKNIDWRLRKRPEESLWFKLRQLTRDEVEIAQELEINYAASVGGAMIPTEWVMAAVDFILPVSGDKAAGYDISAGGKDKSVYISRHGVVVQKIKELPQKTPLEATWAVADLGEAERIDRLIYDKNTMGEDVYPQLTGGERKVSFRLTGIYGQGNASEEYIEADGIRGVDKFRNKRAEMSWNLRKRFEKTFLHKSGIKFFPVDELISIPSNNNLIQELSIPKILYTTEGKIGLESKTAMKSRGVPSPNYFDALMYCYETETTRYVANSFNYTGGSSIKKLEFDNTKNDDVVISFYLTDENKVHILISQFFHSRGEIRVLNEHLVEFFDMAEIIQFITDSIPKSVTPKYHVGNEKIFEKIDTPSSIWYDFSKAGIKIKQNYKFDYDKALILINTLFKENKLTINEDCTSLINQVRTWSMEKGKPKDGFNYCEALIQIVQMLKKINLIKVKEPERLKAYAHKK